LNPVVENRKANAVIQQLMERCGYFEKQEIPEYLNYGKK